MSVEGLNAIAFYPELRNCRSPSASRILEIVNGVRCHHLVREHQVIQIFEPELSPLRLKVLDLLHVRADTYRLTPTSWNPYRRVGHRPSGGPFGS